MYDYFLLTVIKYITPKRKRFPLIHYLLKVVGDKKQSTATMKSRDAYIARRSDSEDDRPVIQRVSRHPIIGLDVLSHYQDSKIFYFDVKGFC